MLFEIFICISICLSQRDINSPLNQNRIPILQALLFIPFSFISYRSFSMIYMYFLTQFQFQVKIVKFIQCYDDRIIANYKLKIDIKIYRMTENDQISQDLINNRQQSFYIKVNEDDDVPPHQLSGDESTQKSLLLSDAAGGSKANFMLTVTTIMKTVIGAGILSLPFTVSTLGYLFGLVVYLLVVGINQFTSYMLLKSKNLSRHSNYSTIMYHLFESKIAQGVCSGMILVNNLGICILQLTIFKQAVHKIIHEFVSQQVFGDFYVQEWFIILMLAMLEIPFTLVSKIQKLKFMSFLGVAGIVIFIISLVINFFNEMSEIDWNLRQEMQPFPTDWVKVATVTPNIMLALAYQMNFFPIYKGLKNSSDSKMNKAALVGLCTVALFYILVGNIGYALYGSNVQPNFLLNLQKEDINIVLYFGMNLGFLLSVFFSFPVMFFGARNNFIALMKMVIVNQPRVNAENFKDSVHHISSYIQNGSKQQRRKKAKIHFYIYTAILLVVAVVIGILVESIQVVFNFVGSIASNAIGYILPCLFYFLLIRYKKQEKNIKYYIAGGLVVFFIPFGVFAIISQYL